MNKHFIRWIISFLVFIGLSVTLCSEADIGQRLDDHGSRDSEQIQLDPFFSEYNAYKYNHNAPDVSVVSYTDHILYRMNCYGYAMGQIRDGSVPVNSGSGYKQQPGEYASAADKTSRVSLSTYWALDLMARVYYNMQIDAARLGYTITEFHPTSELIPQADSNSRMIALVTGEYYCGNTICTDFHFYVQHSDGTWSHKPGSAEVSNKSLGTQIVLTNNNIRACAREGNYSVGALRFYVITKDAVVDHPHGARCCDPYNWPCNHTGATGLYYMDEAGDYPMTAAPYQSPDTGKFDYNCDVDMFWFVPEATRTYTITANEMYHADINAVILDEYGEVLYVDSSTGDITMNCYLESGRTFFLVLWSENEDINYYQYGIE